MTDSAKPIVVLAEGDDALRDLLSLALTQAGWEVACALDGAEALEQAGRAAPQLVILDILLPKMNGLDVLRQLKKQPGFEGVPVLVMSELAFREIVQQAIAAGAQDFLVKPFDLRLLLEKAEKARQQPVRFVAPEPSPPPATPPNPPAPSVRPFKPPVYKKSVANLPTAG